jgi:hypothetical protein
MDLPWMIPWQNRCRHQQDGTVHHVRKSRVVATSGYVETPKEGAHDSVVRLSYASYVSLSYPGCCRLELGNVRVSVFVARATVMSVWHPVPDHIRLRK